MPPCRELCEGFGGAAARSSMEPLEVVARLFVCTACMFAALLSMCLQGSSDAQELQELPDPLKRERSYRT